MSENTEPEITDPAARLISLLSRALPVEPGQHYLTLWQRVFELPTADVIEIHHGLDLLRDLIDELERGIMQISDIKHAVFLKPLPALRALISQVNLQANWGGSKPSLEMALSELNFCSERLQARNPETKIEPDALDEIRAEVNDLINKGTSKNPNF